MMKFVLGLIAALMVALAADAAVVTNKVAVNSTTWTDLGPGPMIISSDDTVVYAFGDVTPTIPKQEGFLLAKGAALPANTPSHVWAMSRSAYGANVFAAPVVLSDATQSKVAYALGCEVIFPPSGTIGAAGAVTLGTALDVAYPCAWMYFPANALPPSRPAGFYYVTCASTTACTAFANSNLDNGIGTIPSTPPASPTPIVGSGAAYTTPTGSNVSFVIVQYAGNSFGPTDGSRLEYNVTYANNANNKTTVTAFGSMTLASVLQTTTHMYAGWCSWRNQGTTTRQVSGCNAGNYGASNGSPNFGTVDETQPVNLVFNFNMANAADYIALHTLVVTRVNGPTS